MSATVLVSSKGQVVIPAEVRERLRLVQGSRLSFEMNDDGSVTLRALPADIRSLKGSLKLPGGATGPVTLEAMEAAVAQRRRREGLGEA